MPRVQPHWNARAATKRGVVLPSLLERLKPYAVEGLRNTALPTHFIHFSQIEKVGLKLKSEYNTPLGIYTYPLTHYTLGLLERGRLPFAADRQYLILLQAKSDANLLYSEPDVPAVEYQKLVQNALRISRGERYLIALAEGGARLVDKILEIVFRGDIRGDRNRGAVAELRVDLRRGCIARVLLAAGNHDFRTLFGHRLCGGFADAAR